MLRISKLSDYAIVIMSYLAEVPEQIVSATTIASDVHVGLPTVSKILKLLTSAELVASFRGTVGGYQLARSPKKITIADIVTAIDGKLAMTECCVETGLCAIDSLCSLKNNWQLINRVVLTALNGLTLQDMIRPLHKHPMMMKGIPIKLRTQKSQELA